MKFLDNYIKRQVDIKVYNILSLIMRETADRIYKNTGMYNYYQNNSKLRREVNMALHEVRKHLFDF